MAERPQEDPPRQPPPDDWDLRAQPELQPRTIKVGYVVEALLFMRAHLDAHRGRCHGMDGGDILADVKRVASWTATLRRLVLEAVAAGHPDRGNLERALFATIAELHLPDFEPLCTGCDRAESCFPLWTEQRKCCPDCTCPHPPELAVPQDRP